MSLFIRIPFLRILLNQAYQFELAFFSCAVFPELKLCQQMDKKMSKLDTSKLIFMCVFLVVVVHLDSPSNKNIILETFFNYHNFHSSRPFSV